MAISYERTLDKKLIKEMDELVSFSKEKPDMKSIVQMLDSRKIASKTAFYYLGIYSEDYLKKQNNGVAMNLFSQGKGELFCDYMLLKKQYEEQKLVLSQGKLMAELQPVSSALKKMSKSIPEAELLYADLLFTGMESMPDKKKSVKLLKALARKGHREALYKLATIYLRDPEFNGKTHAKEAIEYLESSYERGYYPATVALLDCYKNGIVVSKNLEKAKELEAILAPNDKDLSLKIAKRYFDGTENEESNYKESLKYFQMAEGLGAEVNPKYYALIYYNSYLGLKEAKRPYESVLDSAIEMLTKESNKKDVECQRYLADIYENEETKKNIEAARKLFEIILSSTEDPDTAYKLFNIYYDNQSYENRNRKLYDYAALSYSKYSSDFRVFKYYYAASKTPDDNYKKAFELLKSIKDKQKLFYQLELADIYFHEKKAKKALVALSKASKYETTAEYYYPYARLYDSLSKKESDYKKMIELYELSAKSGNTEAAYKVAGYFEKGIKTEVNLDKAIEYYAMASVGGLHRSDYNLAVIYFKEKNNHKALEWLHNGAAYDDEFCSKMLGDCYFYGEYTTKDYEKAAQYYHSAAQHNNSGALYMLGYMLYHGVGFTQDKEKGVSLFEKAYLNGSKEVACEIGRIYVKEFNDKKGIAYLEEAVKKDFDTSAADILGDVYFEGTLVKKNYKRAHYYYEVAAKDKKFNSIYHLGLYLESGLISGKNIRKAYKLYQNAIQLGSQEAIYRAGLCAFKLKKYEEANAFLVNSLSDDKPYGYYLLSFLNAKFKISHANKEDAKYYAEKAVDLGYKKARHYLK